MHPKLKINNLTNLQDARSSAAVGFDQISFSLERGSMKKLSASLIWNMVNWLSGPEIILEMNVASLDELTQVENMFKYKAITIPADEWNELIFEQVDSVILKTDASTESQEIEEMIADLEEEKEMKFEIEVNSLEEAGKFSAVSQHIYLHFVDIATLEAFINSNAYTPFGYALGEEAEEEPGVLHYERIDEFLEIFHDRFPITE